MKNEQNDLYTTAKQMKVATKYVCGWYGNMEVGFGWQVVRMKDNAILAHIGASERGQIGQLKALNHVKAELFDRGINKNDVTFI